MAIDKFAAVVGSHGYNGLIPGSVTVDARAALEASGDLVYDAQAVAAYHGLAASEATKRDRVAVRDDYRHDLAQTLAHGLTPGMRHVDGKRVLHAPGSAEYSADLAQLKAEHRKEQIRNAVNPPDFGHPVNARPDGIVWVDEDRDASMATEGDAEAYWRGVNTAGARIGLPSEWFDMLARALGQEPQQAPAKPDSPVSLALGRAMAHDKQAIGLFCP